jgi:diaminopropionate ammonia-lyase
VQPTILGVEPLTAACALETALAGELAYVPGPHPSVLAGLNAGRISTVAHSALVGGVDGFAAIDDASAQAAVALLAEAGITAGETGAAGLAALAAVPAAAQQINGSAPEHALVLITEGATDPVSYADSIAAHASRPTDSV